jgi:hypothetical protein
MYSLASTSNISRRQPRVGRRTRRSHSASRQRSSHDYLYTKEAEANLVNFVGFLSEEKVNVEREVPLIDAYFIGEGSTMEVYSVTWKGQRVAVKHMKRKNKPSRSNNLLLEQDIAYLSARREFYADVKTIMQEIVVMSRVIELTREDISLTTP